MFHEMHSGMAVQLAQQAAAAAEGLLLLPNDFRIGIALCRHTPMAPEQSGAANAGAGRTSSRASSSGISRSGGGDIDC
jgi:hypothetical protein